MATNFEGEITIDISNTFTNPIDLSTPTDVLAVAKTITFANGEGDDQAESHWHDQGSVSAGSPVDLDLYGGLTNVFGTVINFKTIKAIYIENLSTVETLLVGGGSNVLINWIGAAGDIVKIGPGGCLFLAAPKATGYPVTTATADILRLAAAANSLDYKIVLIGTV